eukprot:TRINITY_DN4747_c0_g1_i1.p1 TRINITY_DN4747_c0_g1~~TRINITY_DN4747_c0_g1_i1.p1  ORF type:complete len:263 (-),score=49.62 TRINITY_DN4747_c0_g1_i1:142-849(-)
MLWYYTRDIGRKPEVTFAAPINGEDNTVWDLLVLDDDTLLTAENNVCRRWAKEQITNMSVQFSCFQTLTKGAFALSDLKNNFVVSLGFDNTISLWSLMSGKEVYQEEANGYCLLFMKSHQLLASGMEVGTIWLWDTTVVHQSSFLHRHNITLVGYHKRRVVALCELNSCEATGGPQGDKNLLVSGSEDRRINIWNVISGECLHSLQGHGFTVTALSELQSPGIFVSGSNDMKLSC